MTRIPFSVEAEVPALWECKCGAEALLVDSERPETKPTKPARTHWDMLLERRSIAELEVLLEERLALLRAKQQPTKHRRSALPPDRARSAAAGAPCGCRRPRRAGRTRPP